MIAVFQREVSSYFKGIMGYLFAAFMLIFAGIYTMAYNLSGYYANFEYVLDSISFIYLIAVPILTMRSVAEEKHSRTDQLLYALPLSMGKIILGKYLAMLSVFGIACGVLGVFPLFMSLYGEVNLLTAYAALLCFFLLGAALIAVGMFMSSLTESQIIAAVLSFGALLLCYLMSTIAVLIPGTALAGYIGFSVATLALCALIYFSTRNYWVAFGVAVALELVLLTVYLAAPSALEGVLGSALGSLALFDKLSTFIDSGLFDLTAIVYYLSVSAVFLFFTVQTMEKKRWS